MNGDIREKDELDELAHPKALFAIACVILVISIVSFALSMAYMQSITTPVPETGEPSGEGIPGAEVIGAMLMMFANVVLMGIILLFHAFLWGAGMLVSAKIVFSKQEKPKWMQIGAWILTAIFAVPTAIALYIVGHVVFALFFMT